MKAKHQPAAPQPIASDKPLISETEMERMKRTENNYMLSEEERLAIIAKHGAPTRPLKHNRTGYYVERGRGA